MKAVFSGTIESGFGVIAILPDAEAEDLVVRTLANGTLAEAIGVQDPRALHKKAPPPIPGGSILLVFSRGPGNGCSVFGPFFDSDTAADFGDVHRGEDDEWHIFTVEAESSEGTVEVLQHPIEWWLRGSSAPTELDDCSLEHIEKCIKEGYREGELCVLGADGESEYRGWWKIGR